MKIILITCKNVIAIFTLKNHGANCTWRVNYSSNQCMILMKFLSISNSKFRYWQRKPILI